MVPSLARESTVHCKLDSSLHGAGGQEYLMAGPEMTMKIPDPSVFAEV
jgi:hypothetical protein